MSWAAMLCCSCLYHHIAAKCAKEQLVPQMVGRWLHVGLLQANRSPCFHSSKSAECRCAQLAFVLRTKFQQLVSLRNSTVCWFQIQSCCPPHLQPTATENLPGINFTTGRIAYTANATIKPSAEIYFRLLANIGLGPCQTTECMQNYTNLYAQGVVLGDKAQYPVSPRALPTCPFPSINNALLD